MFERFTDRARRVVVLAQEEARLINHNYIGTEHILLGLIHEGEGVAAEALESLGISLEAVRTQVVKIIGEGQSKPTGHIPFTPRAKTVLELSLREALQLGHNYIGTEHILLGLIREGEGVAAQILVKLGADRSRVRQQVIQLLSAYGGSAPEPSTAARFGRPVTAGMALSPGTLGATGEVPSLLHVIAMGQPVSVGDDAQLTPISLTIWSTFFELRYVTSARQGPPPAATHERWSVEDDAGTTYRDAGIALSAYGTLLLGTICFAPPPPPEARRLSLLGPGGVRLDIDLPTRAEAAEAGEPGEPPHAPAAEETSEPPAAPGDPDPDPGAEREAE
jgi:hypothetical protein